MNVIPKLNSIRNFLESYLQSYGIEDIDLYLTPTEDCYGSPWEYDSMKQAVEKLHEYVGQDVCIIIDSDFDGNASAAIQYQFLKSIKCNPIVLFHTAKQHGLNDTYKQVIDTGCKLLWIADAGTNDTDECKELREQGIEIICTDHHEILADNQYIILVNNQDKRIAVNRGLSGCGVTYKLVQAYCQEYNIECPDYNDLVATSIIADMCELTTYENRAFVHQGLKNPKNDFIKLLLEKECVKRGCTPEGVSWCIAPLANALARVEEQETKLLFFDALVGRMDYEDALKDIKRVKRQQDNSVKEVVGEVEPTLDLDCKSVIAFVEAENKSYIGLIANKIAGKFKKPTILLRELNSTTWSGSLRSPIPLLSIINESKLAEVSGHEEAAGIVVKKANLKRLKSFLETLDLSSDPDVEVAACVKPKDITLDICKTVENNKELWGQGLPCPQFYVELKNPEVFVYEKKTTTIKLVKDGISFMFFFANADDVEALNKQGQNVRCIVTLSTNEYNGIVSPQAKIEKYEAVESYVEGNWENLF